MKLSEFGKNDGKLVGMEKSDSLNEEYEIRQDAEGRISCSCLGFMSSKKRPKQCKHIRRWKLRPLLGDDTLNVNTVIGVIENIFK